MQRYCMEVAYQGSQYQGWQSQKEGGTIQDFIESALAEIHQPLRIVGSSRTDAGVHAIKQVAHLDLPRSIDPVKLCKGLNALLPKDIRILGMKAVPADFHARFDAIGRHYAYHMATWPNPFTRMTSIYHPYPLDIKQMNQVATALLGLHDFTSFCKKKSTLPHHRCHVYQAEWAREGGEVIFRIHANRYLHSMVRTIVGTLLMLEKEKQGKEALSRIIAAQDRTAAGPTFPAKGLFLVQVDYPMIDG